MMHGQKTIKLCDYYCFTILKQFKFTAALKFVC
jgi:hypothetical protein